MHLVIPGDPVSLSRPRFTRQGRVYDSQKQAKQIVQWIIKQQMYDKRILRPSSESLHVEVSYHTAIPNSWPQKRRNEVLKKSTPDQRKPDIDNYLKFTFDTLNEFIYQDDKQITSVSAKKRYSDNPRTEIFIFKDEETMINEHAITAKDNLNLEQINYLVQKANFLGIKNRKILNVFTQEDNEGLHYYFETEPMRSQPLNCS